MIDYGVGNLASVAHALNSIGFRCRISGDPDILDRTDALILPGVGAFSPAMQSLHDQGLDEYIRDSAYRGKAVVGICLGMQLLADSSTENQLTMGLGLIPGKVTKLKESDWHIGWNSIEVTDRNSYLEDGQGQYVYFNHSFVFQAPREYQAAIARIDSVAEPFPIAVHHANVLGLQFHPEKSQIVGKAILKSVIEGLWNA